MGVSRWLLGLSAITTYFVLKWCFRNSDDSPKNVFMHPQETVTSTMPCMDSDSSDCAWNTSSPSTIKNDLSNRQMELTLAQVCTTLHPSGKLNLKPREDRTNSQSISCINDINNFISALISIDCDLLQRDNGGKDIRESIKSHFPDSIFDDEDCQPLPLAFASLQQYKSIFTELLVYETWAMMVQDYHEKTSTSYNFNFDSYNDHSIFCQTSINHTGISEHKFLNHFVIIGSEKNSYSGLGYVIKQTGRHRGGKYVVKLQIQVSSSSLAKLENERVVSIREVFNLKPKQRLIQTMSSLFSKPALRDAILIPEHRDCWPDLRMRDQFSFTQQSSYNLMQQAAILASYNLITAKGSRFLLIQGPPGTGKTHTLLGIIKHFWFNFNTPPKIMVCAPSNGAIDEIGQRILHENSCLESPLREATMVRLGQLDKTNAKLHRFLLNHQIERMVRNGHLSPENSRYKIREELLRKTNIILTTLASSQSLGMKIFANGEARIDCLIVDEACQAIEPELLMPLVYPSVSKIILIGDHFQLPATIISHTAQQFGLGRSLFERFFEHFRHTSYLPMITLKEQFRMRDEICHFPSNQFYKSQLITAPGAGINPAISTKPYYVINITGSQEEFFDFSDNTRRMSKWNKVEVDLIYTLLYELFQKLGLSEVTNRREMPISVGVITFYQGQRHAILQKLGSWRDLVTVDTVDGYQGQERDLIILSCVRASSPTSEDSIGFARSAQRLNVALTRAKSTLVVVFCKSSFERNQTWAKLIQDATDRQRVFKVDAKFSSTQLQSILDS